MVLTEKEEKELIGIGFIKNQESVYREAYAMFEFELKNHKIIVNEIGKVWVEHKKRNTSIPLFNYFLAKVEDLIKVLDQKNEI